MPFSVDEPPNLPFRGKDTATSLFLRLTGQHAGKVKKMPSLKSTPPLGSLAIQAPSLTPQLVHVSPATCHNLSLFKGEYPTLPLFDVASAHPPKTFSGNTAD